MLQTVLESMLELKWYIALALSATLLVGGALLYAEAKANLCSRSIKVLGLFFDATDRVAFSLAASWLRLLFVIYMLAFRQPLTAANAFCFGVFVLMQALASGKVQVALQQTLNTALVAGAFLALGILTSYTRDVEMDWQIVLIAALLALFILLYSVYFFIKDVAAYGEGGWKKAYELGKKA